MQTEFADIFSLLICDKSTFLQKIAPNIFTDCQNALIRPVKIMLPGPAITTVIAACGIVTDGKVCNPCIIRSRITTVIAACGIVTSSFVNGIDINLGITTVIAACGIVTW